MSDRIINQNSAHPRRTTLRKIVHITDKTGKSTALQAALKELEAATRREAGSISFTFFQALSAEDHFLLIEDFVSEADPRGSTSSSPPRSRRASRCTASGWARSASSPPAATRPRACCRS
jgi:hypothetical protein